MTDTTLRRLESYYDAVPRAQADVEDIGPLTLFVARSGSTFYARPVLGFDGRATVDDVRRVLGRQRELSVPLAFEWVDETTPGLAAVVAEAGLRVERCPLLVLEREPIGAPGTARMLKPDETSALTLSRASVDVGFGNGGTATGTAGLAERDAAVGAGFSVVTDDLRDRLVSGAQRSAACWAEDDLAAGPVGGGSHSPVGEVSEIAGLAVLPAYRRRGLAAALTFVLARDALDHGVRTVFLSAQSGDVARVYERVGFRRLATACIASAPTPP